MATSPQPRTSPLTKSQWRAIFITVLKSNDFRPFHDPLITALLADEDTLTHAAEFVRLYVTGAWVPWNQERKVRGKEMKRDLKEALRGLEAWVRVCERVKNQLEDLQVDQQNPVHIQSQNDLEIARTLPAKAQKMLAATPAAYNVRPLGIAGDLQTLDALDWLLRIRLGKSSPESLFTLLDCGYWVEGQKGQRNLKDPVSDLSNKLRGFRANNPLSRKTEDFIRSIPVKKSKPKK